MQWRSAGGQQLVLMLERRLPAVSTALDARNHCNDAVTLADETPPRLR